MKWAVPLGRVLGVRIRLHFTFLLLLAWVGWMGWLVGGAGTSYWVVLFFLCLFGCVVLHELSHSAVAMRFGAQVYSITLLPIGGVASMKSIPENPRQEFLIAIAGPAVNVVILGVLAVIRGGIPNPMAVPIPPQSVGELADALIIANSVLVAFNLLPAFPMDGGRVLRSLLALVMDYGRATTVAAAMGQLAALGFIVFGVSRMNPFLVVIGVFVIIGARGEARLVHIRKALRGHVAAEAMVTNYMALGPDDSVSQCVGYALHRRQDHFPVLAEGRLVGLVPHEVWLEAVRRGRNVPVREIMWEQFVALSPGCPLSKVYQDLWSLKQGVFPVLERGELVGLLSAGDVRRYLSLREAGEHEVAVPTTTARAIDRGSRFTIDLG